MTFGKIKAEGIIEKVCYYNIGTTTVTQIETAIMLMFIFLDPDQYVYLTHTMNFLFFLSDRAKDTPRFDSQ